MEMAGEAEEQVRRATDALLTRNGALAKQARKGDEAVDILEQRVDEQVMELLALQQPMAVDLRRVVVTLKIANDLERVGDHAVNIAKAVKRMMDYTPLPELPEVGEMVRIARGMLADSLAAFVSRDRNWPGRCTPGTTGWTTCGAPSTGSW
jgi:phosphate transport system protein